MNLPPPFGPVRKRPEFPSPEDQKEIRRDEIKFYGKSLLPQKEVENDDDDEEEEFEDKRPNIESNPFNKTPSVSISFNPKPVASSEQTPAVVPVKVAATENMFATPAAVRTCISRQDILKHRISKEEMAQHKAFANYAYGDPNSKLFIRNLAKDATEDDILRIFGCFFDNDDDAKKYFFLFILTIDNSRFVLWQVEWKDKLLSLFPPSRLLVKHWLL